jgi:hypothetical protein
MLVAAVAADNLVVQQAVVDLEVVVLVLCC